MQDGGGSKFWSIVPEKANHPVRVLILETLWRVGQPLSAIDLVDVLDGEVSMWDAAHHLNVLEGLGVVAASKIEASNRELRSDDFDMPYELTADL
jgi:hypothetical protein